MTTTNKFAATRWRTHNYLPAGAALRESSFPGLAFRDRLRAPAILDPQVTNFTATLREFKRPAHEFSDAVLYLNPAVFCCKAR
jgi:hypothetical protein